MFLRRLSACTIMSRRSVGETKVQAIVKRTADTHGDVEAVTEHLMVIDHQDIQVF